MSAASGLDRLLAVASPALCGAQARVEEPDALTEIRTRRNGFIAFFGALQVFPADASTAGAVPGAGAVAGTLRAAFGALADGHHVFGQDLFGTLLTWHPEHLVCSYDPETGEHERLADTIDGWASAVLAEPEELVGSAFAFDWQERHGALGAAERLVPLLPFVLGGEYDDANLEPRDTLVALRERGALARVVAALPEGAEIEWPLPGTREG